MSILVKGMEMPPSCFLCKLSFMSGERLFCSAMKNEEVLRSKIDSNCPLIEVPPHGRLIDADALHKLFEDQWHYLQVLDWDENPTAEAKQSEINWCINTMHDDAPTIIPAEEGE